MPIRFAFRTALAAALLLVSGAAARAQVYESVGIRAQGMAGAFVAVADDATATWWNPAGLATGAYFNGIVEDGTLQQPRDERDAAGPKPAWRSRTRAVALAFPALGLSYYRLRVSEMRPAAPIGDQEPGRQDQGITPVGLRAIVLNQFGATVGQSLGHHLVLGTTFKLVRGTIATATAPADEASLDRAAELEGDSETHADLDVGAMATFGGVRLGVSVKNLRAPEFGTGDARQALRRQARAGVAFMGRSRGPIDQLAVAFDADLTRTLTPAGEVRHVAAGVEAWTLKHRLGLRAGVSANTIGPALTSPSVGASFGLRSSLYIDGRLTMGPDESTSGWGAGLRVTF